MFICGLSAQQAALKRIFEIISLMLPAEQIVHG
jgi:hypothetical protein